MGLLPRYPLRIPRDHWWRYALLAKHVQLCCRDNYDVDRQSEFRQDDAVTTSVQFRIVKTQCIFTWLAEVSVGRLIGGLFGIALDAYAAITMSY